MTEIARSLFKLGNSVAVIIPQPILMMYVPNGSNIKEYEGVFSLDRSGRVTFLIRRRGE